MVLIAPLSSHPEWAGLLARWHFAEWRRLYPQWTVESVEAELASHCDPNRIPTTLVAAEGAEPIGSVSLIHEDLSGWEHLTPWLASLYVRQDRRRQGIGRRLVSTAASEARRLGLSALYLFTPGQRDFYAALGWRLVAETFAEEEPVTVMSLGLDTPARFV